MKSNHHSHLLLITWASLLLFSCLPFCSAQLQHNEISTFPFQDSLHMTASNPRFYHLSLANAPKDLDLLISALPEGKSCAPKLFVSKTREFPQTKNDADYSSTLSSRNIIFISHKDLKDTLTSLYIGLNSGDFSCDTKISIEWTKEIKTIANEEKVVTNPNDLKSACSTIVRLIVPKEKDIERIVIHLDVIKTSLEELPSLEVFINKGMSVPFTNNAESISRKGSWFEGNTILIDKDSSLFCNDCEFTLNPRFTESSSISIQALTFKKNAQIHGVPMLDGVREGMKNTFRLHKEGDFVLSVKVHQGTVGILFSCDKEPQPKKYYDWDEVAEHSTEIIFGQNGHPKCSSGNYFLRIESQEFSVYSLRILEKKPNQLELGRTTLLTGGISPKEKITYELLVPLYMADEEVLLDLQSKQSLDLDISLCRFPTDCPGLLPADSSSQITNYYGFDDLSIEKFDPKETPSEGGIQVKISPKESGCYPILAHRQVPLQKPTAVCAYLITLSNNQQASPVKFTLNSEIKGPKLLRTNESNYDVVAQNTSIYYALSITDKNAEYVQFQFTRFFGDFDIFISNSIKYPNHQDSTEFQSFHKDLITIKGGPLLSEVYYIGVHGAKASSFSLSAISSKKKRDVWDKKGDWAFTLSPGKPQKGFFLKGFEMSWRNPELEKLYKIVLNQDKDWEGSLCINSLSVKKEFPEE